MLPDVTLQLQTDRGVFAAAAVDPGTKLLLLESPPPPDAAVDVNRRALALCEANAKANGLTNVRVVEPDAVPGDVVFAGIWSNPPIRIGKAALHDLLLAWLGRLTPDGRACLVVQKHLGSDSLAKWLDEQGWPTARRAARAGYRVLEVRRA